MHLVVLGLNHRTAPVEIRERLSISEDRMPDVLACLRDSGTTETLLLSTCNRTEIYAYAPTRAADSAIIQRLGEACCVAPNDFVEYFYTLAGHKAVKHLFRVAAGIDSMVVGEAQILGQVKDAYSTACGMGFTGPVLNTLFQQAITVGKRARTDTDIGRGAFSIGSAAVHLAESIFEELRGRTVLIIGAGTMGELTMTHLSSSGVSNVIVANRTYEKAVDLAAEFGGRAIRFEEIPSALAAADIVIASTGSQEPIVDADMTAEAMRARRGRPMFFIDIAVPRDIAPDVQDIDNVFVYDIDDLQTAVDADAGNRQAEVKKIDSIIEEQVGEFMAWFRTLDAVPVVTALRDKFEKIREAELAKLHHKYPDLSQEQIEAIDAATRSIVNRISHHPMIRIKEYAAADDSAARLDTICDVFGIQPSENEGGKCEAEGDRQP